ncbi:MAG: STAS domain-containing protein [Candidatus Tectimicrobiota bacterium]
MQLWTGIVAAPLIGMLDTYRAQHFTERLLEKIVEVRASVALVDITGVPMMDTGTAQYLLEAISAVRLLGAQVILTGVRPAIARRWCISVLISQAWRPVLPSKPACVWHSICLTSPGRSVRENAQGRGQKGAGHRREESLSVITVQNTLMVTMPADPDDVTVSALQDKILLTLERSRARGVMLDVSAVETLDSFFARTLAETVQMVSLMGGQTVIAGMRPSVAITVTQLGLTLGNAMAALDVDRALTMLDRLPQQGRTQ